MPPDQFAQFNWQQHILIKINDSVQLIKVLAQQQTNHSFSYLLVHRQRGQYSDVVVHNIEYNIGTGQKIPVAISSHSYARQKLAKQVFNLNTTETKNRQRVEYHLKPLSHDVPYTTLPVVTITARYRNGGTEFVPPTTYALMDGAFAATGGASGSADGSANPYDPYIYLDCLDPMYVPETGSGSMPPTLDPATNSFFEYKDGEWKWFNMADYPGKNDGYEWKWWEQSQCEEPELNPDLNSSELNGWWNGDSTFQTQFVPIQAKPNFSTIWNQFPKTSAGTDLPALELSLRIGGEVLSEFNKGRFTNACAIRLSYALNHSGISIPEIPNKTWKGADGKNYFRAASQLKTWLTQTFGEPDVVLFSADKTPIQMHALIGLQNRGLYLMLPKKNAGFTASGHASLWGGINAIGGNHYLGAASAVYLWRLPQ